MRILDICPQLPFPPVTGGKYGIFHRLHSIAGRGHFIHIASLVEEDEGPAARALEEIFSSTAVVANRKPTVGGALASLPSRTPYQLGRFHNPVLLQRCRELLRNSRFDIVQAEGIHAAYYVQTLGMEFGIPTILRVQDVLSLQMERSVRHTRNPLMKFWLSFDQRRVRAYESRAYRHVHINVAVSENERERILMLAPDAHCEVIPPGVDLHASIPMNVVEDPHTVLWIGAFRYTPNLDSFWWFYNEIVPRIIERYPGVRIRVAGTGMPEEIQSLRNPQVEFLGFVPDIRQTMARAAVCVVPLRIGSGVRIKLLEMFAMGRAVVSTSIGAEGLGVTHDRHLLIADAPDLFAEHVAGLLQDPIRRSRLGAEARAHAEKHYSLEIMTDRFEAVYRSLVRHGWEKA